MAISPNKAYAAAFMLMLSVLVAQRRVDIVLSRRAKELTVELRKPPPVRRPTGAVGDAPRPVLAPPRGATSAPRRGPVADRSARRPRLSPPARPASRPLVVAIDRMMVDRAFGALRPHACRE